LTAALAGGQQDCGDDAAAVSSMMIVDCVSSSLTAVRRRFTDWPPTSPTVPQRQPGCPVL